MVYAPPPKKDAITDEGKIKEDFAKGFCKQMGYSPQECAALQTTDHWKELAESYMDKAEDLYDKATQLTTEDVVSMAEHAVNEVGEQIDSAAHYLQNTSAADIAEDAIETGEAIVGAAGEMAGDALDWIGETYERFKKADNLSEMAGMAAAAGIDIVNPGKKIGKAYELGKKVDKKLHKPKSNSGKRNGEDGGSVKEKKKCGGRTANQNKGDCAEKKVHEYYAETHNMMDPALHSTPNGMQGIDHIAMIGNTAIFIETKANTARHSKAQEYGDAYRDKQESDMERGTYKNKGRYKQRTKAQHEEYLDHLEGKDVEYHKCRVQLQNDPSGCYGRMGKGKCKKKGEVKCGPWQTKH